MKSRHILILLLILAMPILAQAEEPAQEKPAVQETPAAVDEPLFDAGRPPFLVRAFGLNYPVYKPVESEENYRFYMLFGPYYPLNLCSSSYCFDEFFGAKKRYFINFEVEYQFLKYAFGSLGIKFGTGFLIAQSKGIFSGLGTRSRDTVTFVILPVELLLVKTLSVWKEQILVPYVEGGIAYFGFFQKKPVGSTYSGGRTNLMFGVGIKFLLDWMDYKSAWKLDSVHGINNTYLTFYYRYIFGIQRGNTMDFSGSVIMGGISFDI